MVKNKKGCLPNKNISGFLKMIPDVNQVWIRTPICVKNTHHYDSIIL